VPDASVAAAKDLCIQLNTGTFAGSQLVLKKVKLGKRTFGPLQGYFAIYIPVGGTFLFAPLHGSSIRNAVGGLALGIEVPDVDIQGTSGIAVGSSSSPTTVNLVCNPGPDGKLDELDPCSGNAIGGTHVIACPDAMPIPG
jgi:hypothetical protein